MSDCSEVGEIACGTAWCVCFNEKEEEMSSGREHYERRISQQRAADKRRVKRKHDYDDWKDDRDQ